MGEGRPARVDEGIGAIEPARGGAELLGGGEENPEKLVQAESEKGIVKAVKPKRRRSDENAKAKSDASSDRRQRIPREAQANGEQRGDKGRGADDRIGRKRKDRRRSDDKRPADIDRCKNAEGSSRGEKRIHLRLGEEEGADQKQKEAEHPVDRSAIEDFLLRDRGLAIVETLDVKKVASRRPPTRAVPGAIVVVRPYEKIFEPSDRVGRDLERRVLAPCVAWIGHASGGGFIVAGSCSPDEERIFPDIGFGWRVIAHAYCSRALSTSPEIPRGRTIRTRMMTRNWVIRTN